MVVVIKVSCHGAIDRAVNQTPIDTLADMFESVYVTESEQM